MSSRMVSFAFRVLSAVGSKADDCRIWRFRGLGWAGLRISHYPELGTVHTSHECSPFYVGKCITSPRSRVIECSVLRSLTSEALTGLRAPVLSSAAPTSPWPNTAT